MMVREVGSLVSLLCHPASLLNTATYVIDPNVSASWQEYTFQIAMCHSSFGLM